MVSPNERFIARPECQMNSQINPNSFVLIALANQEKDCHSEASGHETVFRRHRWPYSSKRVFAQEYQATRCRQRGRHRRVLREEPMSGPNRDPFGSDAA